MATPCFKALQNNFTSHHVRPLYSRHGNLCVLFASQELCLTQVGFNLLMRMFFVVEVHLNENPESELNGRITSIQGDVFSICMWIWTLIIYKRFSEWDFLCCSLDCSFIMFLHKYSHGIIKRPILHLWCYSLSVKYFTWLNFIMW